MNFNARFNVLLRLYYNSFFELGWNNVKFLQANIGNFCVIRRTLYFLRYIWWPHLINLFFQLLFIWENKCVTTLFNVDREAENSYRSHNGILLKNIAMLIEETKWNWVGRIVRARDAISAEKSRN